MDKSQVTRANPDGTYPPLPPWTYGSSNHITGSPMTLGQETQDSQILYPWGSWTRHPHYKQPKDLGQESQALMEPAPQEAHWFSTHCTGGPRTKAI